MSTAVNKSLEVQSTLKEHNIELSHADGENVTMTMMSVYSDISDSPVKADADSSLMESGQNKKDSEKLQVTENDDHVSNAETDNTDKLKPAPRTHADCVGMELVVQLNDDSSKWKKSKQTTCVRNGKDAADLRKAHVAQLATGNSDSTDSYHNCEMLVCSERSKESVDLGNTRAEVHASNDVSTSRTSLSSRRSHTRCKKLKNETNMNEGNSQAASLMSVRSDESQVVTDDNPAAAVTASRSSVRSMKPHRRNQIKSLEAGSLVASVASIKSDESQIVAKDSAAADMTAPFESHTLHKATKSQVDKSQSNSLLMSVATSRSDELLEVTNGGAELVQLALSCGGNVGSQLSVRPSATTSNNNSLVDAETDSRALGPQSCIKSLHSAESSNSCSVVISKPPKHIAVNKTMKDAKPAAEAETSKTNCTTGDSVYLVTVANFDAVFI